jgi:hypothetical protein
MKIYLATRFSQRERMMEYRTILQASGHEVTSRWLDFIDTLPDEAHYDAEKHGLDGSGHVHDPELRQTIAAMDIEDVMRADAIMLFTRHLGRRGGMFVEFGAAIAHRVWQSQLRDVAHDMAVDRHNFKPVMRLMVIGPRINVFQNFPGTEVFDNYPDEESLDLLDAISALQAESVFYNAHAVQADSDPHMQS